MEYGGRIKKVMAMGGGSEDGRKERKREAVPWSVFVLTQRKVERNVGFMARGQREVIGWLREKNATLGDKQKERPEEYESDLVSHRGVERGHIWKINIFAWEGGEKNGWKKRSNDRNTKKQSFPGIVWKASASVLAHCTCYTTLCVCVWGNYTVRNVADSEILWSRLLCIRVITCP